MCIIVSVTSATSMSDYESDSGLESDVSDRELQAAFSSGLLKKGLVASTTLNKRISVNNVEGLKEALSELENGLPWIERLDLTVDPVPALKALEGQLENDTNSAGTGDSVHDDFRREMTFYRLAQAAVLEGIPRLHSMKIATRRPDDYFAEMAKTDEHMKKVREKLVSKQHAIERSEKAKKLRELKKFGKKVQTEVIQKRQKQKREMIDAVKKYRKGQSEKLDFLENEKGGKKSQAGHNTKETFQPNKKRQYKNKKFGFGGQKKRSKYNTAKSAKDMSDYSAHKHGNASKVKTKGKAGKKSNQQRPGKQRRQKMKSNKRKR